jgi:superfamily I DNA and/or RNA helicase
MFSIANKIAYGGQMVKAQKDAQYNCVLGPAAWFHVAGKTVFNKQVITEEIELAHQKIQTLIQSGHTEPVFVISPFRSVARLCGQKFKPYENVSCGTIHTFQGKEADIVFLVLGSDPASPGARKWASAKPNMLNVALTRARRRI